MLSLKFEIKDRVFCESPLYVVVERALDVAWLGKEGCTFLISIDDVILAIIYSFSASAPLTGISGANRVIS